MTAIHGRFSRSQAIIQNGKVALEPSPPVLSAGHRAPVFVMGTVWVTLTGAEIDCEDKNGNSPLHIAARYGHELLLNTLITNGADATK